MIDDDDVEYIAEQPVIQSTNQMQSVNCNQTNNQSIDRSINQTINQSINQSINQ